MEGIKPKIHNLVCNITHYNYSDYLQLFIDALPKFYKLLDEASNMLTVFHYDLFICHTATELVEVIRVKNISGALRNIESKVDFLINSFRPYDVEDRF